MRLLWKIADFVRAMRRQMRFGDLSRESLRLLRVEVEGNAAECDWMARPADPGDADLPASVRNGHATIQTLEDAIAIRALLFHALPDVQYALLRAFRPGIAGDRELIISGSVIREQQPTRHFHSVAMRAKLLGLQFWLEDGALVAMRPEPFPATSHEGEPDLLAMRR